MIKLGGDIVVVRVISKLLATAAVTALIAGFSSNAAYAISSNALPQGGNVAAGSASFSHPNSNTLNVNQSSERAVINWNSFNVGDSASVEFKQPDTQALTVNRVVNTSTDPTQILGSLKSNGQVMVLDKNGVLFGANARIDVGGIIASTGDVDNNQVMSGANGIDITGMNGNAVINQGPDHGGTGRTCRACRAACCEQRHHHRQSGPC